jgi:hypothetical protein
VSVRPTRLSPIRINHSREIDVEYGLNRQWITEIQIVIEHREVALL